MNSSTDFDDSPQYNLDVMDKENDRYGNSNLDMTVTMNTSLNLTSDLDAENAENEQSEIDESPTPIARKQKDVRFHEDVLNNNMEKHSRNPSLQSPVSTSGANRDKFNRNNNDKSNSSYSRSKVPPSPILSYYRNQDGTKENELDSELNSPIKSSIKNSNKNSNKNTNNDQLSPKDSSSLNSSIMSPNGSRSMSPMMKGRLESSEDESSDISDKYSNEDEGEYLDRDNEDYDSEEDIMVSRSRSIVLYHSKEELKGTLQRNYRNWHLLFRKYSHIPEDLNTFQRRNIEGTKGAIIRKGDTVLATQKVAPNSNTDQTSFIDCMPVSNGFCIWIDRFENIMVPKSLFSDFTKYSLAYRVQLSLFHTGTQSFFGRTYKSPTVAPLKTVQKTASFLKHTVKFDRPIFYHSRIYDSSVIVVGEIILCIKSKGIAAREISVGWSILRVFGSEANLKAPTLSKCLNSDRTSLRKGTKVYVENVYKGTPRALFNIKEPLEVPLTPHQGTKIVFHHFTYEGFKKYISHLVEEDGFYSKGDSIPGLKNTSNKFLDPIMESTATLQLYHLTVNLPSTLERDLMHYLEETRSFEQGKQLDKERSIVILKRHLRFGYHNTCTYVKPYGLPSNMELHTTKTLEPSGFAVELELVGSIDLKRFIRNKDCALILELFYEVGVPAPLQQKTKKEGGIFGIFARKRQHTVKNPEIDYKLKHICVGQYLLLPYQDPIFKTQISCEMDVGPGRAITGSLIYAPQKSRAGKISRPVINFSLKGMDFQESFHSSWREPSEAPISPQPSPKKESPPEIKPPSRPITPPVTPKREIIKEQTPIKPEEVSLEDYNLFPHVKDFVGNSVKDINHKREIREHHHSLIVDNFYIHILGIKTDISSNQNIPTHFYFKLNFFNKNESSSKDTPLEVLNKVISGFSCHILANHSKSKYGYTFNFSIDPFEISESEFKKYNNYLENRYLFISIYDSDSHSRFGVVGIPLNSFKRVNDNILYYQETREYKILESIQEIINSKKQSDAYGKLLVKISNVGTQSRFTESQPQLRQIEFEKSLNQNQKIINAKSLRTESSLAAVLGGNSNRHDEADILVQRALSVKLFKENQKEELLEKTYTQSKVTERKLVYSMFGASETFEIPFSNIGRIASKCTVISSSPKVSVSIIENVNMVDQDYSVSQIDNLTQEIIIKPKKMAKVLFRFLETDDATPHVEDVELNVVKNGSTVRVIQIRFIISQPEIHQIHDVYVNPTNSLQFELPYNRNLYGLSSSNQRIVVYATNNVESEVKGASQLRFSLEKKSKNQQLSFYAMIYSDKRLNNLEQLWRINVNFVQ